MMLNDRANRHVYLALGSTDMRKSINGLALIVVEEFDLNLFSGHLFAFCNRNRTLIKILYWDGSGFCLWMKRLEEERFPWPDAEEDVMKLSREALDWLLQGLDPQQAHRKLHYQEVV